MRPPPRSPTPLLGRSVRSAALAALAATIGLVLAACTNGGSQNPLPGGPQAVINSPPAGSLTAGTYFFSVQAIDPSEVASVRFEVGGAVVGTDSSPADGLRVFVSAADHPAGPLTLRAVVTGKDGRTTTLTRSVTNVPQPPSSATVGANGAALGTFEADGSLSTLIVPPGTSPGLDIAFEARTKEEVKDDTGVDYDALGITFLGAQDVLVTGGELDRTLAVSSGGFGPQVQPEQAVLNYLIGPDEDGDGVGELYVVNTASVAPNGDVVSDPVPVAQVGSTATVSQAGSDRVAPLAAGIGGAPGSVIAVPVAGFNPASLYGNVAEFDHADGLVRRYGRIYTSETGAQTFVVQVPPLRPGSARLTLRNLGSGYASEPIDVQVTAASTVAGDPVAVIEHTLDLALDVLEAFDALLAGSGADSALAAGKPIVDRVRANLAIMEAGGRPQDSAMIAGLAARIVASGVDDVLGDVHGELSLSASYAWAQQAGCNDILDRADKGIDMINTLTDLGGYDPPAGERVDDMHSYAFDEWWGWVKRTTRQIDSALGGNACPESPPGPAGPGGSASPSGMGAAVPPGGNMGGNALPPGYRPIPDYARGPAPMATELARGRFVISVAASGSAVPFKGTTDAGGYFMIPLIPEGQPFVAVALDTQTGENRVASGVGPAFGDGAYVVFDFSSGESQYSEARWDGGGDGTRWLDPLNWEGDMLPVSNSNVVIEGPSGLTVELDNFSGDGSRVTINSLELAAGTTLELSRGTLEILSASTVEGDLLLTNGTLKLLADLTMEGDTAWNADTLAGSARFVNRGEMTLDNTPVTNPRSLSGNLVNEATVIMRGTKAGGLTTSAGASIVNALGATFEVHGLPAIQGGSDPTPPFDNLGTLRKVGSERSHWTGVEVNHLGGTVEVLGGTLLLGEGSHSTGATWQVAAGAALELGWQTRQLHLEGLYQGAGEGVVRLAGGDYFAISPAGATFDFPVGGVEWAGAEIKGPGALTNLGKFHIVRDNPGGIPELSGHLINESTMALRGNRSGGLKNASGAKIDNLAGATFELWGDQGIAYADEPLTLTNDGHLAKVGGGMSSLQVCYQGSGTVDPGIALTLPCP